MLSESSRLIYQIENLRMTYGERTVLEINSLGIHSGEILSIIGPSGAGKSTFLRILNFLEKPVAGSLIFEGINYDQNSDIPLDVRRRVTTVFQRPMLLSRSVWDNVAFGMRIRGKRNQKMEIQAAIDAVGLDHLAQQHARTLSGGEAQRVALARAMVIQPDVLLMDEPTANLDPYNVGLIEEIIQEVNQNQNKTIVLVTHNVFQARRMADRVAFFLGGNLIEIGKTSKVFEDPNDRRTAAFVQGDMVY